MLNNIKQAYSILKTGINQSFEIVTLIFTEKPKPIWGKAAEKSIKMGLKLKNCCGCCELKMGVTVIGIFMAFVSILQVSCH